MDDGLGYCLENSHPIGIRMADETQHRSEGTITVSVTYSKKIKNMQFTLVPLISHNFIFQMDAWMN